MPKWMITMIVRGLLVVHLLHLLVVEVEETCAQVFHAPHHQKIGDVQVLLLHLLLLLLLLAMGMFCCKKRLLLLLLLLLLPPPCFFFFLMMIHDVKKMQTHTHTHSERALSVSREEGGREGGREKAQNASLLFKTCLFYKVNLLE